MLGLGWSEMLVIAVVALIVIGPKDLPRVLGEIGRFVGVVRRMGNDFRREINKATALDEVRDLRKSITDPIKQAQAEINKEFNVRTPSGGVAPSGVIKPADPKVEDVTNEIRAAAGMPPLVKPAAPAQAAGEVAATATPAMTPLEQATPAPVAPVTTTPLPAAQPAAAPAEPAEPAVIKAARPQTVIASPTPGQSPVAPVATAPVPASQAAPAQKED